MCIHVKVFIFTNVSISVNCGAPPTWGSGVTVQYNDTVEGSIAVYNCEDRGHELVGTETTTCLSNGTWNEEIIECRGMFVF